jgi:hypothetical protein
MPVPTVVDDDADSGDRPRLLRLHGLFGHGPER